MTTSQGRLLTCVLLSSLSATAWADLVNVNTTIDQNAVDDAQCSLREAAAYLVAKNQVAGDVETQVSYINGALDVPKTEPNPTTGSPGSPAITTLAANLSKKKDDLAAEQAKSVSTRNPQKIRTLQQQISALQQQLDNGLAALEAAKATAPDGTVDVVQAIIDSKLALMDSKYVEIENQLIAEKTKTSGQDAALIERLEKLLLALAPVVDRSLLNLNNKLTSSENALLDEERKADVDRDKALVIKLQIQVADLKERIARTEEAKKKAAKILEDFRATSRFGCKSADSGAGDTVVLKNSTTPYLVKTSPITLASSIVLRPESTSNTDTEGLEGLEQSGSDTTPRTVIKAENDTALFIIDDGLDNDQDNNTATPDERISVTLNDIDLQGCKDNDCAGSGGKGGIILNRETLFINSAIISGGNASVAGGAIYNAGKSTLNANQVLFQNNKAGDGAAIHADYAGVTILNSLFTQNTATIAGNAIVTIVNPALVIEGRSSTLSNDTFSGNTGTALSVPSNILLASLTIVLNRGGINLHGGVPAVYNSIIAGNTDGDCISFGAGPDASKAYFANNLFQTGCALGTADTNNRQISGTGNETLIADADHDGKCDLPPAVGLLCPLAENGGLTKTHKPRLLAAYTTVNDSPIVNKGFNSLNGLKGFLCSASDQRNKTRTLCDIGAVELQGLLSTTQGQDIVYGQIATFDLNEKIGDGELLPKDKCAALFGPSPTPYKDGCVRLFSLPTKGTASFDDAQHVLYASSSPDFHGFDRFTYVMTTTISRFSDADNDRAIKVNVKVVSEPGSSPSSKSLDTGSTGIFSLLMLGLAAVWRRIR